MFGNDIFYQPGQSEKLTRREGIAQANVIYNSIQAAKSVLIIGGGVSGVELAGEIKETNPNAEITLVHSGPRILHATRLSESTTKSIAKQLGITIICNEKILLDQDDENNNLNHGFNLARQTLITDKGTTITSDIQFRTTGISPNSSIVREGLGLKVIDGKGFIKVRKTGQLEGYNHIFALGDVSNLDKLKIILIIHVNNTKNNMMTCHISCLLKWMYRPNLPSLQTTLSNSSKTRHPSHSTNLYPNGAKSYSFLWVVVAASPVSRSA
jgi:NADPH-dependent 2,4-dienoyl-CoA reductase/sulfur reductase-like enzyme